MKVSGASHIKNLSGFWWTIALRTTVKQGSLLKRSAGEATFKVKYHFFEENHFGARSMYKACEMADGEYLFLLDHDDMYTDNALERVLWYITNYCNREVVAVRPRCVSEDGILLGPVLQEEGIYLYGR